MTDGNAQHRNGRRASASGLKKVAGLLSHPNREGLAREHLAAADVSTFLRRILVGAVRNGHATAMCFSAAADLIVGVALVPVAVLSLREVKHWRELPFAVLPAIFALHQFIESAVWAGQDGNVSAGVADVATLAYLLIALPLLPTYVPLAVVMLEPRGARLRVSPFIALGVVVSAYLTYVLIADPIAVTRHPYCLTYHTGIENGGVWATLYVVAVIGPALLSGYRSIVAFGVLNLIGIVVVGLLYAKAFASLWCVFAAAASVLVLLHMVRRRRLPDAHRVRGVPLLPLVPTKG